MTNTSRDHLDELLDDFATEPVPEQISVNGFQIALVNTSLAFALPGFIAGMQIGRMVGLEKALYVFVIGGAILAVIGFATGIIGIRTRLSSYMLLRHAFGHRGANIVNLFIAVTFFGWFGVNADLFGEAGQAVWQSVVGVPAPKWIFVTFGGLTMTAGTIFGFKFLQKLTFIIAPIQALIIGIIMYKVLDATTLQALFEIAPDNPDGLTTSQAISAVVGSFITVAAVMPDYTRYGSRAWHAATASGVPFLLAATFAYIASALAGIWTQEADLIPLMLAMGIGFWAFLLVLFSGWIGNASSLYGCELSFSAIFPRSKEWQIVVVSGILGTLVALMGILSHFIEFIYYLGIIFTPIAAIYFTDYVILNKGHYREGFHREKTGISIPALVSWSTGILAGHAADIGWFRITGISVLDTIAVSMVVFYVLARSSVPPAMRQE